MSDRDGHLRVDGINPALAILLWIHKPAAAPHSHQPKSDKDVSNLTIKSGETVDLNDLTVRFLKYQ